MLKNAPKVEIPVRSLNDLFIWFDIKPDIVIAIRKAFRNQNYWVTFEKVKKNRLRWFNCIKHFQPQTRYLKKYIAYLQRNCFNQCIAWITGPEYATYNWHQGSLFKTPESVLIDCRGIYSCLCPAWFCTSRSRIEIAGLKKIVQNFLAKHGQRHMFYQYALTNCVLA